MKAFEALEQIRRESASTSDLGRSFEKLFCQVAIKSPELEIESIYPIAQWPDAHKHALDGRDIGVDLVAVLTSGDTVAIQCKAYSSNTPVSRDDVRNFLAGSQNSVFTLRWLVTTSGINDNVRQMLVNTNVKVLYFTDFHSVELDTAQQPPRELWPLQQESLEKVVQGFSEQPKEQGRGRLIMACGTGKTFTALRITEKLVDSNGTILFLAPSIALVAQARREWLTHSRRPLQCTVICSDATAGSSDTRQNVEALLMELSCSVTTEPGKIARSILNNQEKLSKSGGVSVVFCTYHSLDKLITAQKEYQLKPFDLAIVDEAHRTAGTQLEDTADRRLFKKIHYDDEIRCHKRLYMTATPKIYSDKSKFKMQSRYPDLQIIDMNDEEIYGPLFSRLSFKEAVKKDMLTNVRVIALGLSEDELDTDMREQFEQISNEIEGVGGPPEMQEYLAATLIYMAVMGLGRKGDSNLPDNLPSTIVYANTIRKSKWFTQVLEEFNSGSLKPFADLLHGKLKEVTATTPPPPPPPPHTHCLS